MARKASSKPESSNSTATIGFEGLEAAEERCQQSGASSTAKGSPQGERLGVHQFGVSLKPAWRESANTLPEGKPQVVSAARDNNANFAWVQHFIHHLAPQGMAGLGLANGTA